MSEFEALRNDLADVGTALADYARAVNQHVTVSDDQIRRLWADNAELRDELHAVANRLENLTRAVMADPAEVAAVIVNDANRETAEMVVNDELRKRKDRWGV